MGLRRGPDYASGRCFGGCERTMGLRRGPDYASSSHMRGGTVASGRWVSAEALTMRAAGIPTAIHPTPPLLHLFLRNVTNSLTKRLAP